MTTESRFGPFAPLTENMEQLSNTVRNISSAVDKLEKGSSNTHKELSGLRHAISKLYSLVAVGVMLGCIALAIHIVETFTH